MLFDFIRPELRAAIKRWHECLIGAGLLMLALMFWRAGGLLSYLAPFVVFGALGLVWIGFQRGRFRGTGIGVGTVQVVEGQITYFGPQSGGAVAVAELERLTLDGTAHPPHWRLTQEGLPELAIPVDAHGADALFDAFSRLPGLRTERMLSELSGNADQAVVIWERAPLRPPHAQLH